MRRMCPPLRAGPSYSETTSTGEEETNYPPDDKLGTCFREARADASHVGGRGSESRCLPGSHILVSPTVCLGETLASWPMPRGMEAGRLRFTETNIIVFGPIMSDHVNPDTSNS